MSARDIDPVVWAAAYGAAFASLNTPYDVKHAVDDEAPRAIGDAAVLALHPEMRGSTPESTKARDTAWARLVKAVETRWREDFLGAAQCDYQREIEAAKDALRALGVGEDLLSSGAP